MRMGAAAAWKDDYANNNITTSKKYCISLNDDSDNINMDGSNLHHHHSDAANKKKYTTTTHNNTIGLGLTSKVRLLSDVVIYFLNLFSSFYPTHSSSCCRFAIICRNIFTVFFSL